MVESEKLFNPSPNGLRLAAKLANPLSPLNQPLIPPSLGTALVISAKLLAALAAAVTFSALIPETESENSTNAEPNMGKLCVNVSMPFPPVNQLVSESNRFPAVRISNVSARVLTPFIASGFISLAPTINGNAFVIN